MFGHVEGDLLKCLSDGTAFLWIRNKLEKQPRCIGPKLYAINPETERVLLYLQCNKGQYKTQVNHLLKCKFEEDNKKI